MSQMTPVDIVKTTRKRIYTAYHEDGLIDIFVGLFFVIFSILIILDFVWMAGIWFILIVPMYASTKNALTVPRIGYVKLQQARGARIGMLVGVTVLAVLGLFVFAIFYSIPAEFWEWMEANFIIISTAVFSAVFLIIGAVFHIKRFYIYAVATLVIIPIGDAIGLEFYQIMLALGILIVTSGMVVLYGFIRSHPESEGEEGSSGP